MCKTLIFGGHFILTLLAVKEKIAKMKPAKKNTGKLADILFRIHIPNYDIRKDLMFIIKPFYGRLLCIWK